MTDDIKSVLLKIALDLSKEHGHDFTAQRVLATYWEVFELFEQVSDGLDNRSSEISPDVSLPLMSNQEQ